MSLDRLAAWLGVMVILAVPIRASAGESWVCPYPSYHPTIEEPVTVMRFDVEGDELVETEFQKRYKILQDNEFSIVAVASFSWKRSNDAEPEIGAFILLVPTVVR